MPVTVHNTPGKVSATLAETARAIPADGMTLNQLFRMLGEQGLMMFCLFLTIPFVLPIQIPGLSTVFGLVIALIAFGVTVDRVPNFPRWLMERRVASIHLLRILDQGAHLFACLERWICPRWFLFTNSTLLNRVTGLLLLVAASLLALPLIIPFSNILPALAILLLTVGILQRDGLLILVGYLATLGTAVYFVVATLVAIQGLHLMIAATMH